MMIVVKVVTNMIGFVIGVLVGFSICVIRHTNRYRWRSIAEETPIPFADVLVKHNTYDDGGVYDVAHMDTSKDRWISSEVHGSPTYWRYI